MTALVLSSAEIRALVPMRDCIDLMRTALIALARGDAVQPLRSATWLPDRSGLLGVMPGFLGEPRALGVKVVTVFPGNTDPALPSHQGVVLLFDPESGALTAILDGEEITAVRTAAVSAVATDLLARPEASDLALLGCGEQARTHLAAMALVRPIRRVRVWNRTPQKAAAFAERESEQLGIRIEPMPDVRQCVEGADIVCTLTGSPAPILSHMWLSPGVHINAVGACTPNARELDSDVVAHARVFVDRRESALNESGDLLIPMHEGAIDEGHILGEIGELLAGQIEGRIGGDECTLFKSLGLAVEDLAMARAALDRARQQGVGRPLPLSEHAHAPD